MKEKKMSQLNKTVILNGNHEPSGKTYKIPEATLVIKYTGH